MLDKEEKPNSGKAMPTLTVDWEAYGHFLDESDLTDDEKREFIETIWSIVVGFVDLGFSVRSPERPCGQEAEADAPSKGDMVHSIVGDWDKAAQTKTTKKNGSFEQSGAKPRRRTP